MTGNKDRKNNHNHKKIKQGREGVFQALALTTTIGVELAVAVSLGYYGGQYLDKKMATGPWFVLAGVLIGLAVGTVGVYKTLKGFLGE
jgi:F0F1-type ATP synthase assembly protein I